MVQILFPKPLPARHQQTKLFRRIFLCGFMMYFMRSANTCQVAVIAFKCFKAIMDKPIMKNKVDDTVYTDACAYPETIIQINVPYPHQP